MAKNLGFGSSVIRILLLSGFFFSLLGLFASRPLPLVTGFILVLNSIFSITVFLMLAHRKLPVRVKQLRSAMNKAAEGDLTIRGIDIAVDEVGMLNANFNEMLQRLSGMISSIRSTAEELKAIGATVGTVASQGVAFAEGQSRSAASTNGAALQIRSSIEEVNASVEGLSRAADINVAAIQQMTTSTAEINQLVEHLVLTVERASDSMARMATVQKDINDRINSLLENTTRTSDLVMEMDQSVQQIEQNAQVTVGISADVLRDAELGNLAVESTIMGMEQIKSSAQTVQTAIDNLSVHAASIGTILQVIDEVTEQTKLLALNASIIAAQAGEHGKGFGVVAHEIKELARRTTSSTREIAEIVNGVKDETEKAVNAITLSKQAVGDGEILSRRSGDALKKIVSGVKIAADQVTSIAYTTEQHAQQSENMRFAVSEVTSMVEHIVKATTENARDAEAINNSAEEMPKLVKKVHDHALSHNIGAEAVLDSSETIVKMIEGIAQACQIQMNASEEIVEAAAQMSGTARENLETTKVMEGAVSGLSNQIRRLEKEVSSFKTEQ